jgi:hypothetical protein
MDTSTHTEPVKALIAAAREALRHRKDEKTPRSFLKVLFANRTAGEMQLPDVLRDPEVYMAHPCPAEAAAIMVVHRFAPQVQAQLFNYNKWSIKPQKIADTRQGGCRCVDMLRPRQPDETGPDPDIREGHVMSTDPGRLAPALLRDILTRGKKFRLELPTSTAWTALREGLQQYIAWKMKGREEDAVFRGALGRWADMVMAKCMANQQRRQNGVSREPEGYPALLAQMTQMQAHLVFGPEDRAPHAMFFACGKVYASALHDRLEVVGAYVREQKVREEVLAELKDFQKSQGAEEVLRLPYLYGAWKAKKGTYRWIAGTARQLDQPHPEQEGSSKKGAGMEEGPPKNALTEVAKRMVRMSQHLLATLRKRDLERRSHGQPAHYCIVEDIEEFVTEFRQRAHELKSVPWATYDFTTMYEALDHERLVQQVMTAARDAWEWETTQVRGRMGEEAADRLRIGAAGWCHTQGEQDHTYTLGGFEDLMRAMLRNLYMDNGDGIRRQVRGLPMGLDCAPQWANLYGFAVEKAFMERRAEEGRPPIFLRRFIDDIYVAGADALEQGSGVPSMEEYGMQYKCTSNSPHNLIYLGVRLYMAADGTPHSVLHDRAVEYPITIARYPERSTVAPESQLAGVLTGRFVAAYRTCSHVGDFQEAVSGIFVHAIRRHYSRQLVHSVWTRFLHRRLEASNVHTSELRAWFTGAWQRAVVDARAQGRGMVGAFGMHSQGNQNTGLAGETLANKTFKKLRGVFSSLRCRSASRAAAINALTGSVCVLVSMLLHSPVSMVRRSALGNSFIASIAAAGLAVHFASQSLAVSTSTARCRGSGTPLLTRDAGCPGTIEFHPRGHMACSRVHHALSRGSAISLKAAVSLSVCRSPPGWIFQSAGGMCSTGNINHPNGSESAANA